MTIIEGHYFSGQHPVAIQAQMTFTGREAALTAWSAAEHHDIDRLRVSPRIGTSVRFILLPNGAQFACADHPLLDTLPQESPSEGPVAWLEARWFVALACVAIVLATLVVGYFFGLPAAAEKIAYRIPMETEMALGAQALSFLDERKIFRPTELDILVRREILRGFDRLRDDLPLRDYYRLVFRSGAVVGPNAFALPGGVVVITDEMVNFTERIDEVLAILAHEIGHLEHRHTMRSLLQNSVIGVAVATVTSDAATLSAAVTGLPVVLAQTKYSRDFESAADDYAFNLLNRKGYSPAHFAAVMERLERGKNANRSSFSWVATHPITHQRVKRARAAAAD